MLDSQRISIRLSEIRERLNVILALKEADYNDLIRTEESALQIEFRNSESKYRSAVITEGEESKEKRLSGL